jgi:energy-coupling factor transporter transmembrane protein EcfT
MSNIDNNTNIIKEDNSQQNIGVIPVEDNLVTSEESYPNNEPIKNWFKIIEILLFALGVVFTILSNKAFVLGVVCACIVVVLIGWFHSIVRKKEDQTKIIFLIISALLAYTAIILLIAIFSTHQQFYVWANGTATPTNTPTSCPTCEEISCPTPDITPCPTIEITPCPTIEITPCPEVETGIEDYEQPAAITIPPWDFKDGCISQLWKYDPYSSWSHLAKLDESCDGMDYATDFGFTAKRSEGLLIKKENSDYKHKFGIFRTFTEHPSFLEINLIITDFSPGVETSLFRIGLGKIGSNNKFTGTYIELITDPNNDPKNYPITLYVRDQDYSVTTATSKNRCLKHRKRSMGKSQPRK